MPRVYLGTSFVSACVTDRDDTARVYRRQVSTGWWKGQPVKHELFVAQEVLAELSHPDFRQRSDATTLIHGIALLPVDQEVRGPARILVREKAMPGPVAGDAIHVVMRPCIAWSMC